MKIMCYPLVRLRFGFSGCARPILITITVSVLWSMVAWAAMVLVLLVVSLQLSESDKYKIKETRLSLFCLSKFCQI